MLQSLISNLNPKFSICSDRDYAGVLPLIRKCQHSAHTTTPHVRTLRYSSRTAHLEPTSLFGIFPWLTHIHTHTHIHRVLMMVAKVRAYTFVRLHEPRYSRNKLRFHCGSKLCFCHLVIFTFRPCISLVCWCTVLLRLVHNLTHALWFRWHERPSIQKYFLLNLLICPVIFSGKILKLP